MPQLLPRKTTAKAIWAWALVAFAVAGWFAAPVQAAFAELVNYQGKLFDSNDNAVPDDDYNIEFKLYTVATGGSPIWTETRTGGDMVTINDGLFSVLLGEVTSLDGVDFNQDLYLSVNIGGTSTPSWDGEMSPRKRLSSVPSAFTAGKAYELDATYATTTNLFATNSTTTNLSAANASTTQLRTATLIVGSDTVTDITGTGLEIASGALRVATGSLGITSSQWTTNASDIYYSTGNVGIGTTTPGLPLSVVGGGLFTGTVTAANFVGTSTATSTLASGLDIATGCFAMNGVCINLDGTSKWMQNGEFAYRLSSVGIGTDTPEEMLDVNGNARVLGNLTAGSASWAQVGNGLTVSNATGVDLARLTATTIAYVDGTNDVLRTYSFDGTDWTQVGNSGSVGAIGAPRMGALTATTVALADIGLDTLRTYSFDGTDWTQVGNSLSLGSVTVGLALAGLNTTDIAYVDGNNDQLRTYRFDGTDWTQVGNSLTITGIGVPAMAALSSTTVAFADSTSDSIRTFRFDGTDWVQVGENYVMAGNPTGPSIAALNGTDIAFADSGLDVIQTYRFDGQEWNPYGDAYSITGAGVLGVTSLNTNDIAYIDINLDTLTTYRLTDTISFVSSDRKVGIGVIAPARMLDVRGVAGVDLFDFASSTGDSMLRLTSAGYLGIGTSSPSYALSVAGDVDITGALRFNANPGTLGQILMSQGTSTPTWVATSSLGITAAAVLTGGTEGYLARWISGTTLGTSTLLDDGTYSGVNATSSSYTFNVGGIAGTNPFNVASSTGSSMFTVLANGKVGIGTSSPAYELTVRGGAWITDKLRIGTTTASPIVIGDISGNARGTNAIDLQSTRSVSTQVAASARSVAIGSSNTITGTKGVVIGSDSSAGASGVAIGDSVVAIDSSVAIGVGNDASSASYAIAIGNNSDVIYSYSTAIGSNNYVNQMESLALGNGNTLNYSYNTTNSISDKAALVGFNNTLGVNADQSGSYVSILGSDNQTYGSYNVAVGNSNTIANDNYSSRVAIGFSNIVYGDSSTVVGNANTSALGAGYNSVFGSGNVINTSVYTTLVGYGNYVSSNLAAVMGYGNSATGAEAAAFGRNNNVSGQTSTAVGYANTASGRYSTAVGFDSDATGTSSSAFGWKARATASGTTAIGFNLTNAIANSLMIGPSQSAAATILSTGEFKAPFFTATSTSATSTFAGGVGIGTTTPSARLAVTGGASGDLFALANNSGVEALRVSSSGKLSVSNTAAPSYSPAEFYVDTDPNNPATQALFITAPGNGNRIFFGTSTKTSYALNLTNVSVVENMPYFLTPDAMGWGATNYSHDIGRSGNNVVYQSSGSGGGDHIWYGSSTAYTNYTTSPERARLTGDGRFGIGTSSPAYELTVRGGAWITDKLRIGTTTASPIVIGDISGNTRGTNAIDLQSTRSASSQVASGNNSVAIGALNTPSGTKSIAIGYNNAAGTNSVAIGEATYAFGSRAVVIGYAGSADTYSVAIGPLATGQIGTVSIGKSVAVSGQYGVAVGYETLVTKINSIALGSFGSVTGTSSIALGGYASASGEESLVVGFNSSVSGNASIAVGSNTTVTGAGSAAFGYNLTNSADGTFMIGPSQSAAATILSTGEFKAPFFNAMSALDTSMFAGKVAIGASTAEAKLDILTGSNDVIGLRIATTTGAAPLFYVSATSTGGLDYARVAVGTTTTFGNVGGPLLDQFTVAGRIYSTWRYASCDLAGISIIATIVANTASVCGPFAFVEDTDGGFEVSSAGNPNFLRLRASTAASIARGEGASLRSFADFVQINNNPSLETWARPQGSNEGWYKIGFFLAAHDTGAHSSDGVYFSLNSTSTNWHAVVRTGANVTEVDTGIAHSTTDFSKFRIDTSLSAVQFYINGALVANIATNIPSGVNLSTGVSVGIPTVSGSTASVRNFDIQLLRIWVDDPPGGIASADDESVEAMSESIPLTFEDFVGERLSQTISERIEAVKEDMLQQALSGFENFADSVVHRIYALTIHAKTLYATAIAVLPDGEILVPAGPSQIAGSSMIPSGSDYVDVVHEGILLTSKIFVTPLDSVSVPLVIEKTEGVGFRVRLSQTQNRDIRFDWLVIQTYGVGGSIESVPGETRFEGDEIEVIEPVPTDDSDGVSSDGSGDSSATPPPDDTSEPEAPTAPESTGDSAGEPAGDTTSEPSSGSTGGSSGDSSGDEGGSAAPSSSGDSGGGGAGGTTSSGGDTGGSSSTSSGGDSGGPSASSSGGDSGGSSSSGGDSGGSSSGGDSGGGSSGGDSGGSSSGGSTGGGAGE